jgi:glutamine cyclotransferase
MNKKLLFIAGLALLLLLTGLVPFINGCKNSDKNHDDTTAAANSVTTNPGPKSMSYSIGNTVYPHDTASFTQGLVFYKGGLYEGTGLEGRSKLMKVDLKSGKALRTINLDAKYFGEGITILNDTIYQLTWKNKIVFVYTLKDFKKIKAFPISTEGWGITHNGKELIVCTGGSNLYFYEPSSFRLLRTMSVMESGGLAYNLNELEYADGYIYANQWDLPYILKIDPSTGIVEAKADLSDVLARVKSKYGGADVLNGIAYDEVARKMYITGKNWPELYEIQFSQ